ncbi:hypothetical protein T552_00499 [Pneumocystis carinii B80]|uniref:Riboflavin kinase n=1 Tax=Pneumocystis carinii (strain B80) TaxID=1408658 RepID=A0A0W4ZQZ2_PNEC8|nr:hypothetical protein T552_00499 [Pneumocystis carinii B80]KTW30787.1 hypothetical protein T552_00499 [Pneumocystis carinii B80]
MSNIEIKLPDNREPESGPEYPYPIYLKGKVIKGYGRGKSELEIPTANISEENLPKNLATKTGIYYGWGRVMKEGEDNKVYSVVMSIGWNPYYNNNKLSVEVHFIHEFKKDFYEEEIRLIIMGFIRPECNYISKELLIEDIQKDIVIAKKSLERETYSLYKKDKFLVLET